MYALTTIQGKIVLEVTWPKHKKLTNEVKNEVHKEVAGWEHEVKDVEREMLSRYY